MIQYPQIQGVMAMRRGGPIPIVRIPEGIDMVKMQHSGEFRGPGIVVAKEESRLEVDQIISPLLPSEASMSAKKRRKVFGVRRETRRPRGWTRWFNEGLFEAEAAGGSVRLRTVLWGPK
jgi:hypothetical protein